MSRNNDVDKVIFHALKDIAGMKYIYDDIIRNAIESKRCIFNITLTDEERERAFNEIKEGIKNIGVLYR